MVESAIIHWMPCFSASSEPCAKRLSGAVDHHVERGLGLRDPAHAVREARRAEAILAEAVTLAAAAEHVLASARAGPRCGSRSGRSRRAWSRPRGRASSRRDGMSTMKPVLAACGSLGLVLGARDQDREARPPRVRDEPLVPVDHPVVAVADGAGLDQRRVGAGDLGLGHREAAHDVTVAERAEVLLLLLVGRPVQQRVHVALVGRLAVQHPRAVVRLAGLGLHHRELDVAEPHAAPFLRHVRQPETGRLGVLPHLQQELEVVAALDLLGVADLLLAGTDDGLDELAHLEPDLFELGTEGEVDRHGRPPGRLPITLPLRLKHRRGS